MAHTGDVGTEIAPEVADDPEVAARGSTTCCIAPAISLGR
jgi:hypothetical protein